MYAMVFRRSITYFKIQIVIINCHGPSPNTDFLKSNLNSVKLRFKENIKKKKTPTAPDFSILIKQVNWPSIILLLF